MAFVLVVAGLLMIVTGARGTYAAFGAQVASEFQGQNNFLYWIAGIGGVGAVGYIPPLQTFSRLFMALIIIGMVLANRGIFAQLTSALKQGPQAPVLPAESSATASTALAGTGQTNTGGAFGQQPTNQGQATFNGWMNYLTGLISPATPVAQ